SRCARGPSTAVSAGASSRRAAAASAADLAARDAGTVPGPTAPGKTRIQAMLSEELRRKLESLPTQPGCYIMKDRAGAVVYVGKAVNLRARVAQYFQERTGDSRIFIPFL